MAILVSCPTCGKAISSTAWSCPHCGETEFTEPVYQKVKCRYCDGTKKVKELATISNVRYWPLVNKKYESTKDPDLMITIRGAKVSVRDLENDVISNVLNSDRFVEFRKIRDDKDPWSFWQYGDFVYSVTKPCTWCDGKGYTEKFVGRRDIRKPR